MQRAFGKLMLVIHKRAPLLALVLSVAHQSFSGRRGRSRLVMGIEKEHVCKPDCGDGGLVFMG